MTLVLLIMILKCINILQTDTLHPSLKALSPQGHGQGGGELDHVLVGFAQEAGKKLGQAQQNLAAGDAVLPDKPQKIIPS